jgi:hypothetical protein
MKIEKPAQVFSSSGNKQRVSLLTYLLLFSFILKCSRIPLVQMLVIRIPNYPDRFGTSGKFVEDSTKIT